MEDQLHIQSQSSSKAVVTTVVIGILIAIGAFFWVRQSTAQNVYVPVDIAMSSTTPVVSATSTTSAKVKTFTLADVATHSSQSSCYTTINSLVYDLTPWIAQHPGGAKAILGLCGKDGTTAFMNQHGGQGRPEQELATFKIGILTQ